MKWQSLSGMTDNGRHQEFFRANLRSVCKMPVKFRPSNTSDRAVRSFLAARIMVHCWVPLFRSASVEFWGIACRDVWVGPTTRTCPAEARNQMRHRDPAPTPAPCLPCRWPCRCPRRSPPRRAASRGAPCPRGSSGSSWRARRRGSRRSPACRPAPSAWP